VKVLVDTSVWIDFFRGKPDEQALTDMLREDRVITHPWVILELELGHLGSRRRQIVIDLWQICGVGISDHHEIQTFINEEGLYGKGLSLVDVELLYTCLIRDCLLWTNDKALKKQASKYGKIFQ